MTGDDLDIVLVERGADHVGRGPCVGDDVGTNPLGLSVDVDADDPRLRHGNRRADNKTGLCSRMQPASVYY
jgi:hypothetical protein